MIEAVLNTLLLLIPMLALKLFSTFKPIESF